MLCLIEIQFFMDSIHMHVIVTLNNGEEKVCIKQGSDFCWSKKYTFHVIILCKLTLHVLYLKESTCRILHV